jgi:hypothetical protein
MWSVSINQTETNTTLDIWYEFIRAQQLVRPATRPALLNHLPGIISLNSPKEKPQTAQFYQQHVDYSSWLSCYIYMILSRNAWFTVND